MTSFLSGAFGVAALGAGLAVGSAAASDVLSYPPGPPSAGSPVYAPASLVTGDVSLGVGWLDENGDGAFELLGAGRVNAPLQGGPWNLTGEIWGGVWFQDPTFAEVVGAAHLYYKTDRFAHGVYAAATGYGESGYRGHELSVGVEGAAFMGSTTLVGRLGYNAGNNTGGSYDYWSAEGIVRYYVTPNTKLAGIVAWWSDGGGWMMAGGFEHLFAGTNMTGFARAAWFTEGGGYDGWELLGGARFFFHRPDTTLQQHDWDIPFAEATVVNF